MDNGSLRVAFRYKGEQIGRVTLQRVRRPSPPGESLEIDRRRGFWIELRNRRDEPLYRRPIRNPLTTDIEYPTGDPLAPLGRAEVGLPEGEAVVIVPYDPQATLIALFGAAAPSGETPEAHELKKIEIASALQEPVGAT